MKKAFLLAGVVLAGFLAAVAPVSAQTNTYSFDVTPSGGGATGKFHVTIQKYSSANANLPGKLFRISDIHYYASPNSPNEPVQRVLISFFGKLNGVGPYLTMGTIPVADKEGVTGIFPPANGFDNPANTTLWSKTRINNMVHGSPGGVKGYEFDYNSSNSVATRLKATNRFVMGNTSRLAFGGTSHPFGAASFKLTLLGLNGSKTWSVTGNLSTVNVPEASSLALLLPGLLPLGIVLRKRSRSRASVVN